MTTTAAHPLRRRLSRIMLVNAAASASLSAAFLALGGLVEEWLGLPRALTLPVGIALIGWVAGVLAAALRPRPPRRAVLAIAAVDVVWVAASLGLVTFGWVGLTGFGVAFVLAQAVTVGAITVAELAAASSR